MRKLQLLLFSSFYFNYSFAATITWDGGGSDGLWSTASNWVGDVVPGTSDKVILDNSVLMGSYIVTLPNTAVTIVSLEITPNTSNTINLILPFTNSITTGGFVTTGSGYTVIINNGGIFQNRAAVTGGTNLTIADSFRINNGGRYCHKTRSGHAAWVSRLSSASGTENGNFEFDVPSSSYLISLSNRVFGNLILSAFENGTSVTYSGSGSNPLTLNGSLQINSNVSLTISMSANFIVKGNFSQSTSSVFNIQTSTYNNAVKISGNINSGGTITESGSGLPTLELTGTNNPNLILIGSIMNDVAFSINNPAGATLLAPLTLPYQLKLTNGKIVTTSSNLLTMIAGSTYTGGSIFSFVEGPMKKIGNTDFIFPVGVGNIYAPVGISGGSGSSITDEFTAEYIRENPQSVHGINYASGIDHISYAEYWRLARDIGTATKQIQLDVHAASFCKQLAYTFVSQWNGTQWTNKPSASTLTGTTGPYELGNITTTTPMTSFGDFTLATDQPFDVNPLPIMLVNFAVKRINTREALINWELAESYSANTGFEVQKSIDNRIFSTFGRTSGNERNRFYHLIDTRPGSGITYYRLKIVEENGNVAYSKVVPLINDNKGNLVTSISPNPVTTQALLTVCTVETGTASFTITNTSGVAVRQWQTVMKEGNNLMTMDVAQLPAGIYQIVIVMPGTESVLRFVKQ